MYWIIIIILAYQSYFTISIVDNKVEIKPVETANFDTLMNLTSIVVEITAHIVGKTTSTFTVLDLEIIGE